MIVVVCRRCRRELRPWPLRRSARCAPKDWVYCIAPIEDGVQQEMA